MALSFLIVAVGQMTKRPALSLFGLLFCSAQGSLGEASFVALSAFYDSRKALSPQPQSLPVLVPFSIPP